MEYKVPVLPETWKTLLARVEGSIYEPVREFTVQAWISPEPLAFTDRCEGAFRELTIGESWSTTLFECAWFKFECSDLPSSTQSLFARIDVNGELYIANAVGTPVRGLTCVRSMFEPAFGAPGKTIYEIPPESVVDSRLVLWADAGMNDLLGVVPGGGRIELAEICIRHDHTREFFYDLEVAMDFHLLKPDDDSCRQAFHLDILQLLNTEDWTLLENCASARQTIQGLAFHGKADKRLRISAIGHAHLDLAWLWPIRETIRKGARTLSTALYNLDRYEDYRFGCSQPQLLAWIKEHYPDLFLKTKAAVADGKIEPLGTFWVEPDCNIPNGESLVRQILHGRRFFQEEYGHIPNFCWQPDVFGYNGQLPQILKKSGHDFFMTQKLSWNVVNRFPHHSFHWEGIDGTSILVHMLPEETYNGPALPRSVAKIEADYAETHCSSHAMMVFGIGDGGGGPDAEHFERLRRLNLLDQDSLTINEPASAFFQAWSRQSESFPTHKGELYLERHQGTFTTQADLKWYNRRCEILLKDVEWAAIMATERLGSEYPATTLDTLWKEVLLLQFHDILPGSSIKRVHEEAAARYKDIIHTLEQLRMRHCAEIAQQVGSSLVFNTLSWTRSELVYHEGHWHRATVPPMGWAILPSIPAEFEHPAVIAKCHTLENEFLRADFSNTGFLSSLLDKTSGKFCISDQESNLFVAYKDEGDAWDFPINYPEKDIWLYLRQTPLRPKLLESSIISQGVVGTIRQRYKILDSTIELDITLKAQSRLLEFQARINWRDPGYMLRVQFPTQIVAPMARYEIPFGSILRSTGDDGPVERAQIECPAQQWVDLTDAHLGLALINDAKYGFRIKGSVIDMAALRCVPYPGLAQLGHDGNAGVGKSSDHSGLGHHEFRYALYPHRPDESLGEITKAARCFNNPPLSIDPEQRGTNSDEFSAFTIDTPSLEVTSFKPAENGTGYILRLSNVEPHAIRGTVQIGISFTFISETDLAENVSGPPIILPNAALTLKLSPFEVRTFHIAK